jgi:UDP-N-acetylglucosamine 2-epimerase (non-hydrolysing)
MSPFRASDGLGAIRAPRRTSPTGARRGSGIHVMIVLGTRPEGIKLAPVIRMLRAKDAWRTAVVSTGQHQDMLTRLLPVLDLDVDVDLSVMRERHSLPNLTARVLTSLEPLLEEHRPDVVVVQGDTTTAMCAALGSFYARVRVAHVEAGLRSGVADDPFPEELNRRIISQIASWHFAPTQAAAANLYAEGVSSN